MKAMENLHADLNRQYLFTASLETTFYNRYIYEQPCDLFDATK